jgi:hypothetical protein
MSEENAMDQTVPLLALISDIGAVSAFFQAWLSPSWLGLAEAHREL